jgi:hypothetical protein
MKKFSALIALVLLAVAGTGYAVTCAYDNVPAATLLVPYWKVSLNGATGAPIGTPIAPGGVDTLVSIVNVSTPGIIAHVTVWNKYSKAILDFNVPLTGKDEASFSMRDVMNGHLNVNPNTQTGTVIDPCGVDVNAIPTGYAPSIGFGPKQFIRFSHPEAVNLPFGVTNDASTSISLYATDAFAAFRNLVWDSLDESGDISTFTDTLSANILDTDNPGCKYPSTSLNGDGAFKTDLSGYLTIDVVNFCTNYFPDQPQFYTEDAIATVGWSFGCQTGAAEGGRCFSPNTLFGDVFYVDTATQGGNISGDPAVPIEFDRRLVSNGPISKTFFGKFVWDKTPANCIAETTGAGCVLGYAAAAPYQFPGDGREPLGDHYGFRYLTDSVHGAQSWLIAWRSDWYQGVTDHSNLCFWLASTAAAKVNTGMYDPVHQLTATVYDNDENFFQTTIPGGPSGHQPAPPPNLYLFLESQRINLLAATDWNQTPFTGGWVDVALRGPGYNGLTFATGFFNMGVLGIQHTAPGAFVSVGHAVTNLNNQFLCQPPLAFGPANLN